MKERPQVYGFYFNRRQRHMPKAVFLFFFCFVLFFWLFVVVVVVVSILKQILLSSHFSFSHLKIFVFVLFLVLF